MGVRELPVDKGKVACLVPRFKPGRGCTEQEPAHCRLTVLCVRVCMCTGPCWRDGLLHPIRPPADGLWRTAAGGSETPRIRKQHHLGAVRCVKGEGDGRGTGISWGVRGKLRGVDSRGCG